VLKVIIMRYGKDPYGLSNYLAPAMAYIIIAGIILCVLKILIINLSNQFYGTNL